jgi:hypothetical protein
MMEKLKACPHCGGKAVFERFNNPKNWFVVRCTVCGCQTDGFRINHDDATDAQNKSANAAVWNRRAEPENKPLTAENEESKGRFAGSGEKSEYIKVPNNLSRELLIKEFGISAVEWYESYLADRISLGKTYLNPQKTIYLWATRDRETGGGWFSRLPRQYDGHKSKGHGGS